MVLDSYALLRDYQLMGSCHTLWDTKELYEAQERVKEFLIRNGSNEDVVSYVEGLMHRYLRSDEVPYGDDDYLSRLTSNQVRDLTKNFSVSENQIFWNKFDSFNDLTIGEIKEKVALTYKD